MKYLLLRIIFTIIGPLILIYGIVDKDWLNFLSNVGMYGNWSRMQYNYLRWLSNYIFIFTFIHNTNYDEKRIMVYETSFFAILYITENVTFAFNFAFFHPSKLATIEYGEVYEKFNSNEQNINPLNWAK